MTIPLYSKWAERIRPSIHPARLAYRQSVPAKRDSSSRCPIRRTRPEPDGLAIINRIDLVIPCHQLTIPSETVEVGQATASRPEHRDGLVAGLDLVAASSAYSARRRCRCVDNGVPAEWSKRKSVVPLGLDDRVRDTSSEVRRRVGQRDPIGHPHLFGDLPHPQPSDLVDHSRDNVQPDLTAVPLGRFDSGSEAWCRTRQHLALVPRFPPDRRGRMAAVDSGSIHTGEAATAGGMIRSQRPTSGSAAPVRHTTPRALYDAE